MEKTITFPGKLCPRISLSALHSCVFVLGLFAFLLVPNLSKAQCFNSWQYRVPVTLNYQGNDTLADFQVKLTLNTQALIAAGQMRADAGDLRFAGTDCCTPLCYYIEGGVNTTNTVVWVKADQIMGPSSNIVMLYGDTSAVDASDPDCTFEFWDDFNDANFDLNKWEVRGTPSQLTEANGTVTLTGAGNWEYIRSRTSWSSPISVNYSYQAQNVSTGLVLGYTGTDNRYSFRASGTNVGCTHDPDVNSSNAWFNTAYPGVPFPQGTNYNEYTVVPEINTNAINVLSYCNNTTNNCNTTATSLNQYSGSSFFIGFTSWNNGFSGTYDYVWVTKYSPNALSASIGSAVSVPPRALSGVDSLAFCGGTSLSLDAGAGFTSYLWQNGDTSQSINTQMGGLYTVVTVDSLGCVVTDSVDVTALAAPLPAIAPGDTATCGANPITFSTSQTWTGYSWSNGDTSQSITTSMGGTYSVVVTDANGCTGQDSVVYTVLAPPAPQITGDSTACEGSVVTLDAGSGYSAYNWSTSDQTQTTDVSTGGSYSVTVTDGNGCEGTDSYTVSFLANPAPTVSTNGDTLLSSSAASYQWMLNGSPINGATDSTYIPFATGAYSVMVTYANGCSNTSDTTSVIIGIEDALNGNVEIYPNPTRHSVQIGLDILKAGDLNIRLFDLSGKILLQDQASVGQGTFNKSLNLSDLAEGMYLLEIELNGQKMNRRIMKQD